MAKIHALKTPQAGAAVKTVRSPILLCGAKKPAGICGLKLTLNKNAMKRMNYLDKASLTLLGLLNFSLVVCGILIIIF